MFGYDKNKIDIDAAEENFKKRLEKEPLEKGDLPAMILAGLIVCVPIFLIGMGIVMGAYWLLVR